MVSIFAKIRYERCGCDTVAGLVPQFFALIFVELVISRYNTYVYGYNVAIGRLAEGCNAPLS